VKHPDQTPDGEQPPEIGHGCSAGDMRVEVMVAGEKLRHPIRRTLFTTDVGDDAQEIPPSNRITNQHRIHAKRPRGFIGGASNGRQPNRGQPDRHRSRRECKQPVDRDPGQVVRCDGRKYPHPAVLGALDGKLIDQISVDQRTHEGGGAENQLGQRRIKRKMGLPSRHSQ